MDAGKINSEKTTSALRYLVLSLVTVLFLFDNPNLKSSHPRFQTRFFDTLLMVAARFRFQESELIHETVRALIVLIPKWPEK
jgi:uncharacterized membrane protein YbhN (UPF0104 family)